jgi:uncharacterized protein YraI
VFAAIGLVEKNVILLIYRTLNMATQLNRLVVLTGLIAALMLAGCGGLGGAEATPLPTRTPLPTFTPTPEGGQPAVVPTPETQGQPTVDAVAQAPTDAPAPQPPAVDAQAPVTGTEPLTATEPLTDSDAVVINTPAPAVTPPPAASPTAAGAQVTTNDIVNIRTGPGTNYGLAGSAQTGETFRVTGKNAAGDWWQIEYNGQGAWIFGQLVTATGTEGVAVAQNIPAAPTAAPVPPTNTPAPAAPQPTAAPVAEATQPPAAAQPDPNAGGNFPFTLGTTERCDPNPGTTYFTGYVRDSNNNLLNAVCIHVAFYEPRKTVCSGCDGVGDGNWGHSPFGGPAPAGTPVEIFVVECPANFPPYGQSAETGFGNLTPQSPKWTRVINQSEQCTGITFYKK